MPRYDGPNRRRVFRLRLPADALLKATINGLSYHVIEVSEFSFVVTCDDVHNIGSGGCQGWIHWSDGKRSEFNGEIGRLSDHGRVIWQVSGIQMQDVVGEQRRLILKYPARTPLRKIS